MERNLIIEDFRDLVGGIEQQYPKDEDLYKIMKTCIQTLWIMHEQGFDLPTKALMEIKKYL